MDLRSLIFWCFKWERTCRIFKWKFPCLLSILSDTPSKSFGFLVFFFSCCSLCPPMYCMIWISSSLKFGNGLVAYWYHPRFIKYFTDSLQKMNPLHSRVHAYISGIFFTASLQTDMKFVPLVGPPCISFRNMQAGYPAGMSMFRQICFMSSSTIFKAANEKN